MCTSNKTTLHTYKIYSCQQFCELVTKSFSATDYSVANMVHTKEEWNISRWRDWFLCERARMVGLNFVPQPFLSPVYKAAPYPLDLIATAACLHFGHLLRHRLRLGVLLRSCLKVSFNCSFTYLKFAANCKNLELGLIQNFNLLIYTIVTNQLKLRSYVSLTIITDF